MKTYIPYLIIIDDTTIDQSLIEDESLGHRQQLNEDSIYIAIKWKSGTGLTRPDGKRLRGKFKIKKMTNDGNGKYSVYLNSGAVVKVDGKRDLKTQGFKFQYQHIEPLTLSQVEDYINKGKIDNMGSVMSNNKQSESLNISDYKGNVFAITESGKFKIRSIHQLNESLYKIVLSNQSEYLYRKNSINKINFINENKLSLNINQVIKLNDSTEISGFNFLNDPLISGLVEENPVIVEGWWSNFINKLEDRGVEAASKKEVELFARQLKKLWVQFSTRSDYTATKENLKKYLTLKTPLIPGGPVTDFNQSVVDKLFNDPQIRQLNIPDSDDNPGKTDTGSTLMPSKQIDTKSLDTLFRRAAVYAFRYHDIDISNQSGQVIDQSTASANTNNTPQTPSAAPAQPTPPAADPASPAPAADAVSTTGSTPSGADRIEPTLGTPAAPPVTPETISSLADLFKAGTSAKDTIRAMEFIVKQYNNSDIDTREKMLRDFQTALGANPAASAPVSPKPAAPSGTKPAAPSGTKPAAPTTDRTKNRTRTK